MRGENPHYRWFFIWLITFWVGLCSAQNSKPYDSISVEVADEIFTDDYGGIYLYNDENLSFTKYHDGKQQGRMMLATPYKVQPIDNPLNVVLFSENSQEIRLIDHNINDIQSIDLRKFGFVKGAFVEDLQQVWLLDSGARQLVQYQFREDKILASYSFGSDFDNFRQFIVYSNFVYVLQLDRFCVYDFRGNLYFSKEIDNPLRIRRQGKSIEVLSSASIWEYAIETPPKWLLKARGTDIVDKNSSTYFERKGRKLYLYSL